MTETVTSKFTNGFWASVIFIGIFSLSIIIFCLVLDVQALLATNWGEVVLFTAFSAITIFIGFNNINATLLKVSAAPEGLILNYLLTRKQIIVNYADIKHEGVVQERSRRDPAIVNGSVKIVLELSTGETIYLLQESYTNFEELAEAIRRARFQLE